MEVSLCKIVTCRAIAANKTDLLIFCPSIALQAKPGQFVQVKCEGFTLRRPISICDADPESGLLRLIFETKGGGTDWLSKRKPDETLDLLGPLGNGYELGDLKGPALFAGGGIGAPPLLFAAKQFGPSASVLLGFRSKSEIILLEDFRKTGASVTVATDDGTYGHHGFVTELLIRQLSGREGKCSAVYACGPRPMLKSIAAVAGEYKVPCQVSMEERMACGVGACLGCACKVKTETGEKYRHVCKNGPVFDAQTIVW